MSSYPPDPHTRRMDPAAPPPGGPEDPYEDDRLKSLRTWLAVVGVLAVAALGVGLWALLTQEEESDAQQGATAASVSSLRERVSDLESDVEDLATKSSVSKVREDQADLEKQVDELGKAAEGGEDTDALKQSVDDLEGEVEQLQQDVDDLRAQQDQPSP